MKQEAERLIAAVVAGLVWIGPSEAALSPETIQGTDLSSGNVQVPYPSGTLKALGTVLGAPSITSGTINGVSIGLTSPATTAIIQNSFTYGNFNTAVSGSFVTNGNHAAQVSGWLTPSGISSTPNRESVGLYVDDTGPPLVATVSGSYTTTQFIPTVAMSGAIVAQLRVGMFVDTDTNPATKYSGTITAFDPGGASITVSGWFQQGNTAAGQTPSGSTAYINPTTNVFAMNAVVSIKPTSFATNAVGFELDVLDSSTLSASNTQTGMTVVNIGTNNLQTAYYVSGSWSYGYATAQPTGDAFFSTVGANQMFSVAAADGHVDIGGYATASTNSFINFHSSGGSIGYDGRIIVTGGNGTLQGGGTLTEKASDIALAVTSGPVFSVENSGTFGLVCIAATSDCDTAAHHITTVPSQANAISLTGAATSAAPQVSARGTDSNISLAVSAKGTLGEIAFQSHTTGVSSAGLPTAVTCGGTGTVTGTDLAYHVVIGGTSSATCTITPGITWVAAPVCIVASGTVSTGPAVVATTTTSEIITAATATTNGFFNVMCMGTT